MLSENYNLSKRIRIFSIIFLVCAAVLVFLNIFDFSIRAIALTINSLAGQDLFSAVSGMIISYCIFVSAMASAIIFLLALIRKKTKTFITASVLFLISFGASMDTLSSLLLSNQNSANLIIGIIIFTLLLAAGVTCLIFLLIFMRNLKEGEKTEGAQEVK